MFVSNEPVPVSVDGGVNTIYIRPKMDFATKQRVLGSLAQIGRITERTRAEDVQINTNLGQYNLALMVQNIVKWEGPAFAGVPCTAAAIARLDPDELLVDAVLAEINRRNTAAKAALDPNASTAAGAPSSADGSSSG